MTSFDVITSEIFRIGEDATSPTGDITPYVTRLSVSLTMDASSEIQFDVIDREFVFAKANYFQLRRNVFYRDLIFEISRVEVSQDASSHPLYSISARSKNVQLMKRDKDPEGFSGITPTEYASSIAARFNMEFFGQETSEAKNIVKGSSSRVDESVWDVLQRVASDNQFTVFETSNILFFTSQEHLLGKWGDPQYSVGDNSVIPLEWPYVSEADFPGAAFRWELMELPSVSKSDDDWKLADGSAVLDRTNGVQLRPGMTINLSGIPDFEGLYLITAVEFEEGVPDPVRIQFRSPNDPEPPSSGGGASNGGWSSNPVDTGTLPQSIINKINDYLQKNYKSYTGTFDELGFISPAEMYSSQFKRLSSKAIGHAVNLWNNYASAADVDAYINALRNGPDDIEFGSNIMYRTLNYVRNDIKSKFNPVTSDVLPVRIKNNIASELQSLVGSAGGYVYKSYDEKIRGYAKDIYLLKTTSLKRSKLDEVKMKHGSTSIEYRVLLEVFPSLGPSPQRALTGFLGVV